MWIEITVGMRFKLVVDMVLIALPLLLQDPSLPPFVMRSTDLTHTVLHQYNLISRSHTHLLPCIQDILLMAEKSLGQHSQIRLGKFSRLCTNFLAGDGSLPFHHPLAIPSPLTGVKPKPFLLPQSHHPSSHSLSPSS